jgi:Ca2+-binding EF-hand superfamily protein
MIHTKLFQFPTLIAAAAATLALVACSGTEDQPATAESAEAVTAADSAGPEAQGPRRGPPHGPERVIARFDANGDGQLQLSELPPRAQKRFGEADTNGDGIITREELAAGVQARMAQRFAKGDQNGDGKLTQDEVGEQRWTRMRVADADGDGAVTQDELRQAHEQGKLGPRAGKGTRGKGPKGDGGRMFERADANGDGKLEASEVPADIWSHLSVADADGDGAVTRDEVKQARANGTLKPPAGAKGRWAAKDGKGRRGGHLFERFDQNGDDKVEPSEVPERVWTHISVADADGDGAVTKAELEQARDNGTLKPAPWAKDGKGKGRGGPDGKGRGGPDGKGRGGPGAR